MKKLFLLLPVFLLFTFCSKSGIYDNNENENPDPDENEYEVDEQFEKDLDSAGEIAFTLLYSENIDDEKIEKAISEINKLTSVVSSSYNEYGIHVDFKDELPHSFLYNYKSDLVDNNAQLQTTVLNLNESTSKIDITGIQIPENRRAAIINQFSLDTKNTLNADSKQYCLQTISHLMGLGYECEYIDGPHFNLDFIQNKMTDYGVIVILTHGVRKEERYAIVTGEERDKKKKKKDYPLGTTVCVIGEIREGFTEMLDWESNIKYLGITEEFFSNLPNKFPNSLIYTCACGMLKYPQVARGFINQGASLVIGYDNTNSIGNKAAPQLFKYLSLGFSATEAIAKIDKSYRNAYCKTKKGDIYATMGCYPNNSNGNNAYITDSRARLVHFYNQANGPNWTNQANWLSERPISEWYGVTLPGKGDEIIDLKLRSNRMTGSVEIEGFNQLRNLDLYGAGLWDVDIFSCENLTTLNLERAGTRNLALIDCPSLTKVTAGYGYLITSRFYELPKLESLDVRRNSIEELDVKGFPKLKTLDCRENKLKTLDFSNCPLLEDVNCYYNSLTKAFDITGCKSLVDLNCGYNKIYSVVPSSYKSITEFSCDLRYMYDTNNLGGDIRVIDNGVGWWLPGQADNHEEFYGKDWWELRHKFLK